MREKEEPRKVEENGAEQEEGVSPGEALTAALNGDKREQRNSQINEQHAIVERGERSNQCAGNLSVDQLDGEPLKVVVVPNPGLYLCPPQSTSTTTHHMQNSPVSAIQKYKILVLQ